MDKRYYRVVIKTDDLPVSYLICAEDMYRVEKRALELFAQSVFATVWTVIGLETTIA